MSHLHCFVALYVRLGFADSDAVTSAQARMLFYCCSISVRISHGVRYTGSFFMSRRLLFMSRRLLAHNHMLGSVPIRINCHISGMSGSSTICLDCRRMMRRRAAAGSKACLYCSHRRVTAHHPSGQPTPKMPGKVLTRALPHQQISSQRCTTLHMSWPPMVISQHFCIR